MNPFLITNYIDPEHFCGREHESKMLISNIKNQSNTAFFAQRRIGKTALIQQVFYTLKQKKVYCIYIDIFATQNLRDFANQLANSIYILFPEKKTIGKRFWDVIKLMRPLISINELSGAPELSLDISQPRQFEKTVPQLLQFLDTQNIKVVIAIDEFQQIINYPEKNVEALLRTSIQQLKNVNFIFCGSNQKMMHHIFSNAKQPFYASTKNIYLQKINDESYSSFILYHFKKYKRSISTDAIKRILAISCTHTYYTQRLCHEIFLKGEKKIEEADVLVALNNILIDNEHNYFQYRNLITASQWRLLKAIAHQEQLLQPYNQQFIADYGLGTPANVKRALESLLEKELIFYNIHSQQSYYEVQDKFLMRWLQQH